MKQIDYANYLRKCHENVGKTDCFVKRGLGRETIDMFKLGYSAQKNVVTIPYNPNCKGYVHRTLWESDNKYCKFGNEIFNIEALYSGSMEKLLLERSDYAFVTEGRYKDANEFLVADKKDL